MDEKKVKYPALTNITQESQIMSALNRVIETLVPLTGQHRVKENRAITWLDLATAGYKFDFSEGDFVLEPPYQPESPDMATPPGIVNFQGFASFNYVTFSWDQPAYRNHSHVEIWRAEGFKNEPPVPTVLDDAVFRLLSPSIVVSDTVLPADVWRYWARNVSKTGVVGPWTSVDGLLVEVPESPSYLIDKISGEIRQSDLYLDLGQKIDDSYNGVVSLVELTNESYTVRIDTGGAVHGFGLMADPETGRSDFIVRADRFAIAAPQQYDQSGEPIISTAAFPFIVDVTNPANPKVLIKNAYIDKAYIESLVTGSLIADKIVGQTITGTHIRGGDIAIGANFTVDTAGSATMLNAFIKGTMQSNNYAAGSAGWQIRNDGYAEFRNAVVRGTIYADSGYFNGTVYAEKIVGGVYSRIIKLSTYSAMAEDYSFRTALSGSITRGMTVARSLEIESFSGAFKVEMSVSSGPASNTGLVQYECRVLVDGAVKDSFIGILEGTAVGGSPGEPTVTENFSVLVPVHFIVPVPADNATHTYALQYRLVSQYDTFSRRCGVAEDLQTSVGLFINNGDLA